MIGAGFCLMLLCSCATTPNWDAEDSIPPPLPAETSLNKGAGRGDQIRVTLHLNLIIGEMPRNAPLLNLIGLQFLARHLVTFNFPKRIMYLKRTSVGPLAVEDNSGNAR